MQTLAGEDFLQLKIINSRSVSDCNFIAKNLEAMSINRSCFEKIDMSKANLQTAHLRDCIFNNVQLNNINADSAVFRLCQFRNLSATEANFHNVKIENCVAQGTNFSNANFDNASLIDTDFSRSSFAGANLNNSNFENCNLRGTDFSDALVNNISFRDADLRGADFSGAKIESADFTGADLRGAIFDADVEIALFGEQKNNHSPTELLDAVTPIVASLLKQAERSGVISDAKWREELQHTLAALGVSSLDEKAIAQWDEQVSFWLGQAGKIGVNDLFESLRSNDEKTPAAVATMLEGFVKELGLQPDVNTQELVEALFAKLQNPNATCDKS